MDVILIIGIVGAFAVLLAFVLNEFDVIEEKTLVFQSLNLVGALLLLSNATVTQAIPFMILNTVWALASLRGMWLLAKEGKKE